MGGSRDTGGGIVRGRPHISTISMCPMTAHGSQGGCGGVTFLCGTQKHTSKSPSSGRITGTLMYFISRPTRLVRDRALPTIKPRLCTWQTSANTVRRRSNRNSSSLRVWGSNDGQLLANIEDYFVLQHRSSLVQ